MRKKEKNKDLDCVWPIRMKKSFKDEFKEFCEKKGYSMNKRVKILMEDDMKSNK